MAKSPAVPMTERPVVMQARGLARREKLLDAAIKLLAERPLEQISLSDIAEQAGIPVSSAYNFYANVNGVYSALAQRFAEELDRAIAEPYTGSEAESWQTIVETAVARATCLYNQRPDYRQLILGGKAPAEIKLSDRVNDEAIGQLIIDAIAQHFVPPEFPRRTDVFFFAVEIADLLFMLSQIRHGEITDEMCEEAKGAMVGYLRGYLPQHLPRREVTSMQD